MTLTDAQLVLRPPLWARAWVVLLPAAVPFFVRFVVEPGRGGGTWLPAIGALAFAAFLGWRLLRLAAIGTPDGRLAVRNHWRDRSVHRDDVDRVVIDRASTWGWSVQLELVDGSTLPLDVTEVPFRPLLAAHLERQADSVRDWVHGRPQPFL